MNTPTSLMWFRDDLRVTDNPALSAAMAAGPGVALFILDEQSPGIRPLGGAAKWWLHHALNELRDSLAGLGVPLLLYRGAATNILPGLLATGSFSALHFNRRYGGPERAVDTAAKALAAATGIEVHSHAGTLLHEPWSVSTQGGSNFKVFTPFFNALQALPLRRALPRPAAQHAPAISLPAEELAAWDLLPVNPDWSQGLATTWVPGEAAARDRLDTVLRDIAGDYDHTRDRPDTDGTSRFSPALRWGHLSPVEVWEALGAVLAEHPDRAAGSRAMMRQLAWRDFCWNLLYHHPDLATRNLRAEFDAFAWGWPPAGEPAGEQEAGMARHLEAWHTGQTGFGLVDAGMKQLWETGWMHNRVRMVTASFLVKNLGIHWRVGEEWFWDTLVDADAASNPANWQWVAGSGADASPFFRVFNPLLQARKFDPRGAYVARFAPLAPGEPVVDLMASRADALAAYACMKGNAPPEGAR
ncbi:deoxyribodipyrimidine photo-lyase [Paeniglutamicibacter psychrophenolicus]|uniref:Deoxyribodipyrimidine photo-lyase n=1 Tax=Paeniglutamicibacter psychrophenolicus TaxID=257454 RepID=A0ABS4WAV2_9MICC|nr:deoxyribodipyrimidine photo-lyase [Paeniglutamicibacter psychrophenolicus]MBP2373166.1 deoxyribodipyrimidine photo-lyase [Paeniglutamicibacter psychrophenolicus]